LRPSCAKAAISHQKSRAAGFESPAAGFLFSPGQTVIRALQISRSDIANSANIVNSINIIITLILSSEHYRNTLIID
jgi:hypothetical protein